MVYGVFVITLAFVIVILEVTLHRLGLMQIELYRNFTLNWELGNYQPVVSDLVV